MYQSIIQQKSEVSFPEFLGEKAYMVGFYQKSGLPLYLKRWQPTVDVMLDGVQTDEEIFIMIDQGQVKAGDMHRRGGLHIDGYWNKAIHAHSGSGGGHSSVPKVKNPTKGIVKNKKAPKKEEYNGKIITPLNIVIDPDSLSFSGDSNWEYSDFAVPEALILASNIQSSRAFNGTFDGIIGEGGDCSSINVNKMEEIPVLANFVYAGNVSMLHESLPLKQDSLRTLVRLNVRGWTPQ